MRLRELIPEKIIDLGQGMKKREARKLQSWWYHNARNKANTHVFSDNEPKSGRKKDLTYSVFYRSKDEE